MFFWPIHSFWIVSKGPFERGRETEARECLAFCGSGWFGSRMKALGSQILELLGADAGSGSQVPENAVSGFKIERFEHLKKILLKGVLLIRRSSKWTRSFSWDAGAPNRGEQVKQFSPFDTT